MSQSGQWRRDAVGNVRPEPTQDRAAEIADLYFDRDGPNEAECHRDLIAQINLALTAAHEEGRREGIEAAAQLFDALAAKHERDAIWDANLMPANSPAISAKRENQNAEMIRALGGGEPKS